MSSTKKKYLIHYLGDDADFQDEKISFFRERSNSQLEFIYSAVAPVGGRELARLFSSDSAFLFFIDFTHPQLRPDDFLDQLSLIKRHQVYKKVVFVALFKDKAQLESYSYISHFGFSYFFIKGNDLTILFEDGFYLAFDRDPGFSAFAIAPCQNLPYQALAPALVTSISPSDIMFNGDICIQAETARISHKLMGELRVNDFPVLFHGSNPFESDSLFSTVVSIPYPGAWDTADENSILSDTIATFLSDHPGFRDANGQCLVHTRDAQTFSELLRMEAPQQLTIHLEQQDLLGRVEALKPDIIILDFITEEGDSDSGLLQKLVRHVSKGEGHSPLIIAFKTERSSEELQRQLNYPRLIGTHLPLEQKTLDLLLGKYSARSVDRLATDGKLLHRNDAAAAIDLCVPIEITSISEHEITFYSEAEIPAYAQLRLRAPIDCHVIVVPPYRELPKSGSRNHYIGFIHGYDMQESDYVRQFINQIIFQPLTKFEKISLEAKTPAPAKPEQQRSKEHVEQNAPVAPERRTFKYSKL